MQALSRRHAIGSYFASRIDANNSIFQDRYSTVKNLPYTVVNGENRPITGVNLFILLQVMKDRNLEDSRFFTLNQIASQGWTVKENARITALEFLIATDSHGLPLATPETKLFKVVNASEIDGVPIAELTPQISKIDIEKTMLSAGFSLEPNLRQGLQHWISSLQANKSAQPAVFSTLPVLLTNCLLEVQLGLPLLNQDEVLEHSAIELRKSPLSFSSAAKEAEQMSAAIVSRIKEAAIERKALNKEAIMNKTHSTDNSTYIELLFQERQAILAVPFAEKEKAHNLGAKWYAAKKVWFVPKGVDVDLFSPWNTTTRTLNATASQHVLISEFKDVMRSLGLDASGEIVDDGVWHHVSVNTSAKRNKAGSYILSLNGGRDGSAVGTIMNRHTGEQHYWHNKGNLLTPEQRARMRIEQLLKEETATIEKEKIQNLAAKHANDIWSSASSAAGHGYLVKKGITNSHLRQISGHELLKYAEYISDEGTSIIKAKDNYLIVPMTNIAGDIQAIQVINKDGSVKSFMKGAQKKGLMYVLGAKSFNDLCNSNPAAVSYVEGFSTGSSFQEASGLPTVICFDAGNLETVVADTTTILPIQTTRIIGADNDDYQIDRALGFLAEKLGIIPFESDVQIAPVTRSHSALFGEVIMDNTWHETAKGSYCAKICFNTVDKVESVAVEIVPTGQEKSRKIFENRGMKAAQKALDSILAKTPEGSLVNCRVIAPSFKSRAGRPSDWNDLHQREGLDTLRTALSEIVINKGISRMCEELLVIER